MDWFHKVIPPDSVAGGLATLSIAVILGLALGAVRIRGIGLGVAALFFSSMALSALGLRINIEVLSFLRDFSMIIFIYTIGLQVGPSFFGSLRAEGLSQESLNHYIRAAKSFSRWLWRDGRARDHALAHLATANSAAVKLIENRQQRLALDEDFPAPSE